MLEHGAYTLLIDACYDREQFPTLEQAIDWCWARTEAEIDAVKFVLSKFFELRDGIYVQPEIEEAVAKYQANADTNRRIAQEREAKRKENGSPVDEENTNRARSVNEASPNQEPLTNKPRTSNQEPKTKNKKTTDLDYSSWPQMPSDQIFEDWKAVRKQKRALITQTVINEFGKELFRAVAVGFTVDQCLTACVTQNWQGFKAEWLQNKAQVLPMPTAATRPTPTKNLRDVMEQQEAMSE